MAFNLSVHVETTKLERQLTALAEKQIPFARAQALNAVGKIVQQGERDNIKAKFPTATPFTLKSVVVLKANKANPTVTIMVKDIAAAYLAPYEDGGVHKLNGRALLNPKNVKLNTYGNLAQNQLGKLKGLPGVFIGTVKGKGGPIRGLWQRPWVKPANTKQGGRAPRGANTTGRLKLLIRFGDALPVKETLDYQAIGRTLVAFNYAHQFNKAMTAALATARP